MRLAPLLIVTALCFACRGDGDPTSPRGTPGIRFEAGDRITDTIQAELTQALVVEVRDAAGALQPGVVVRFESALLNPAPPGGGFGAFVSRLDQDFFTTLVADTTDSRARAAVLVKLGTRAGTAELIVTVPELGLVDTATYTVRPGAAIRIQAVPKDTTLRVGGNFTLRSAVIDRFGNSRSDAVTYATPGAGLALSGGAVTATAPGRAFVLAQASGWVDTTFVSVVPEGMLAAASPTGIVVFNTDGSDFRMLTTTVTRGFTTDWSPTGTEIAYDADFGQPIRAVNLNGQVRLASRGGGGTELYPEYAPDGAMLFFSRESWRLFRVKVDGTGEELVPMSPATSAAASSLSPDGSRLVYTIVAGGGQDVLGFLTLATGVAVNTQIRGHSPSWSPSGDQIAFIDPSNGTLQLMRADGTGIRTIGAPNSAYSFGIDWSSDGKWISARNASKDLIELIDPQTGSILPLGYTHGLSGPSWKP